MNKKHSRTLSTLLLAVIMVFTMGISAFADDQANLGQDKNQITKPSDKTNEVISDGGVYQSLNKDVVENDKSVYGEYNAVPNTVRIKKEIVIFNTSANKTLVYLPNITYTYTVAPATVTADKHIKDEYGLTATINSGISNAVSTNSATVSYSNADGIKTGDTTISSDTSVQADKDGIAAEGYFDITFVPANFPHAGVYRYVISETAASRENSGVTIDKENYGDKRYLDVYVQNKKDSDPNELQIYGYALYEDKANADKEFDATSPKLTAKSNGFVSDKNDDSTKNYDPKEKDVDIYQTSNVKIEKNITGALGDKTNQFPFEVKVKNTAIKSGAKISYQVIGTGNLVTTAANGTKTMSTDSGEATIGAVTGTVADGLQLKDKEYVYIYGIPGKGDGATFNDKFSASSTVEVKEYNNTKDQYNVTAKLNDADLEADQITTTGTDTHRDMPKETVGAVAAQNIAFKTNEDYMIVTNSMNAISPTNVVMRYAPYLIILAGGMLILLVGKRRRSEEN